MRMIFFDLATRTGWAAGHPGGVEGFGHFELPRTGEDIGAFLCAAEDAIIALTDRFRPEFLAFEAPFLNRRTDTILKLRKLGGLANEVERVAHRRTLKCEEALVDDVRRHFLGRDYPRRRQQAKIYTKVKCRDLGWDVDTDDEADALAGLSYMVALEAPDDAIEVVPLFNWTPPRRS